MSNAGNRIEPEAGYIKIKFLIWPSIIISIAGSILLTVLLNIIF